MILTMARKEAWQLLPYLSLMLLLGLLTIVFNGLTEYLDQLPYGYLWPTDPLENSMYNILHFFLAFTLGLGLLIREVDQKTIEFLDTLPISRTGQFGIKAIMGMLVLSLYPALEWWISILDFKLNRNSVFTSMPHQALFFQFFVSNCQMFCFFAFGLLLSFMRRFAWIMAGILLGILFWVERYEPAWKVFNPFRLFPLLLEGEAIKPAWKTIGSSLGLGLVGLVGAWALFQPRDGRWSQFYQRMKETRWGAGLLALTSVAIGIGGFAAFMMVFEDAAEESAAALEAGVYFPEAGRSRAENEFYLFSFPSSHKEQALELLDASPEIARRVALFFGRKQEVDPPITVDMTDSLDRGHAGLAFWNRVRIDAGYLNDLDEAKAILAHETVHVLIDRISDRKLEPLFNSIKVFHEGLASWIEYRLYRSDKALKAFRLQVAVYHARQQVRFKEFVDFAAFGRKYD
ncbi:MAG: hypothetical protein AAF492_00385, partial [Verrucomicrobiota bacterium]